MQNFCNKSTVQIGDYLFSILSFAKFISFYWQEKPENSLHPMIISPQTSNCLKLFCSERAWWKYQCKHHQKNVFFHVLDYFLYFHWLNWRFFSFRVFLIHSKQPSFSPWLCNKSALPLLKQNTCKEKDKFTILMSWELFSHLFWIQINLNEKFVAKEKDKDKKAK